MWDDWGGITGSRGQGGNCQHSYLIDISHCTSYSVLAIDLLNMCVYACIRIHTTWYTSYNNVKAYSMKKKSRHNDSLSICSMKLCSCKLSTGTNEVLPCSASVSVWNVVGCWECLPFYKEKDATYTSSWHGTSRMQGSGTFLCIQDTAGTHFAVLCRQELLFNQKRRGRTQQ